MDLLGYCDPLCSRAGRPLSFHVSSRRGAPFRAEIVRLRQTDRSPEAPPFLTEPVPSELNGRQFAGRAQEIPTGSYVRVPHSPRLSPPSSFTLHAWVYPTRLPGAGDEPQGLLCNGGRDAGFALVLEPGGSLGLRLGGARASTGMPLQERHWCFVAATVARDDSQGLAEVSLYQIPAKHWPVGSGAFHPEPQTLAITTGTASPLPLLLAALHNPSEKGGDVVLSNHFCGKLDSPGILGEALGPDDVSRLAESGDGSFPSRVASWDFSAGTGVVVHDRCGEHDGIAVNAPTRGATGHSYSGEEVDPRLRPAEWSGKQPHDHPWHDQPGCVSKTSAKIVWTGCHFHDTDLDDACWEQSFEWRIPQGTPAGFYAARVFTSEGEEDMVPFIVSSTPGETGNTLCFLAPTVSYLAYSNQIFNGNPHGAEQGLEGLPAEDAQMRESGLLSLYDLHSDKSGVCYSSSRRPLLNLRPVRPPQPASTSLAPPLATV